MSLEIKEYVGANPIQCEEACKGKCKGTTKKTSKSKSTKAKKSK